MSFKPDTLPQLAARVLKSVREHIVKRQSPEGLPPSMWPIRKNHENVSKELWLPLVRFAWYEDADFIGNPMATSGIWQLLRLASRRPWSERMYPYDLLYGGSGYRAATLRRQIAQYEKQNKTMEEIIAAIPTLRDYNDPQQARRRYRDAKTRGQTGVIELWPEIVKALLLPWSSLDVDAQREEGWRRRNEKYDPPFARGMND
jgi:hypothetical protein